MQQNVHDKAFDVSPLMPAPVTEYEWRQPKIKMMSMIAPSCPCKPYIASAAGTSACRQLTNLHAQKSQLVFLIQVGKAKHTAP